MKILFSNFKKSFFPIAKEREKLAQRMKLQESEFIESRKNIKLKPAENKLLWKSEPFDSFLGDCESCSYSEPIRSFVTGLWCKKHKIGCGYGFLCPENDSEYNVGWNEFEKIKKGE